MSDTANVQPLAELDAATPLATLDQVKAWLNYPMFDTSDDTSLTLLLSAASDLIERYAGPIQPTAFVERHDGWGGSEIILNHCPVVSVAYVNEYRSTGGLVTLPESTPESTVDGYEIEWETGRLIRVFQGNWPRTFFPGSRNIEVSYVAGYASIPPLAQLATQIIVAEWWQQGHQAPMLGQPDRIGGTFAEVATAGTTIGVPDAALDLIDQLRTPNLA